MSTVTLPEWFLVWALIIGALYIALQIILLLYRHLLLEALKERKFSTEDIRRILRFP